MLAIQYLTAGLLTASLVVAQRPTQAPAANGNRPWYLNDYSSAFVSGAVQLRKSSVAEAEASSVAKHIIDGGLEPPQFTEMAQMAAHWVERGQVPATSLSEVASIFASAYTSLHTQPIYSSYVSYVKQHSSIYDLSKLEQGLAPQGRENAGNTGNGQGRGLRELQSIYASLAENSVGHAALETFSRIAGQYARDFDVPLQPRLSMDSIVGFLYNYVV